MSNYMLYLYLNYLCYVPLKAIMTLAAVQGALQAEKHYALGALKGFWN